MADKRIFDLTEEGFLDDITDKVYMWLDKKANESELQEPSWKFKANVFLKILNNFATKFVPNVATVEGKCYWHGGDLFMCNVAYTGYWVPGNFTLTSVDELFARKDVLSALQTNVSNLTTYAQNVAHSIAPEFDPNRTSENPYLANEFVIKDGVLCRFNDDHYGAWDESKVRTATDSEVMQYLEDNALIFKNISQCVFMGQPMSKYIKTDVGVGNVVDYTPVTSDGARYFIFGCQKGDIFRISGAGGSAARLWCFVDSQDKVVSVAKSSLSLHGTILVAPCSGKIIVNVVGIGNHHLDKVVTAQEFLEDVRKVNSVFQDYISEATVGAYINTNVSYGSTISYDLVAQSSYLCVVLPCELGEYIQIRGTGGNAPRLWCFVDSQDKVVALSLVDTDTGTSGLELVAPCSGKLIFNSVKTPSVGTPFVRKNVKVQDYIDDNYDVVRRDVATLKSDSLIYKDIYAQFIKRKYIKTDVGVGNVVDYTPIPVGAFCYIVLDCQKGDTFKISGNGGSAPRLWCFVDTSDKVVSVAGNNASTPEGGINLVAPSDGKVIVNISMVSGGFFKVVYPVQNYIDEQMGHIDNIERIPSVRFEFDKEMFEDSDVDQFDFSTKATIMERIYTLMDGLVSANPDIMDKVDAYELMGITKPSYMGGIGESDSNYLPTAAYETYMYRIIDHNVGAGNNGNMPKKKLFLFAGTHGNEYASQFNCYLFAKNLLSMRTNDYFNLFASYDIYILPVLNGYGSIHVSRANADWVDIDRNFPVSGWHEQGQDTIGDRYSCVYTGPSAGSSAECQLIIALCESIKPDIFVDHHSYGIGSSSASSFTQFYAECGWKYQLPLLYQSLVDCSVAFIKKYPEYFGTRPQLVIHRQSAGYAPGTWNNNRTAGYTYAWGCEHTELIGFAVIVEICQHINYLNGEFSGSAIDTWGKKTFAVGEYTLRNCLTRFCEYMLAPKKLKD